MNLLLLHDTDLTTESTAEIKASDRRFKHLQSILKATTESEVRVGLLNGKMGHGKIISATSSKYEIEFKLNQLPPPKLDVTLVVALPRPKAIVRLVQTAATLGVKQLYLVNALRVEKPFWSSEQLQPESIRKSLLLGLEQARDTVLPEVHLEKRFKPFVEDRLSSIAAGSTKLVSHPAAETACSTDLKGPHTIVIGPEGGFIPFEVDLLQKQGFIPVSIGPRILKSETAMVVLLSQLARPTL